MASAAKSISVAPIGVDGDRLRIGGRWLRTTLVDDDHVVAWTEI